MSHMAHDQRMEVMEGAEKKDMKGALKDNQLDGKDAGLVGLYAVGCMHWWEVMPEYGKMVYSSGGTSAEVQSCVRHLVVCVFCFG